MNLAISTTLFGMLYISFKDTNSCKEEQKGLEEKIVSILSVFSAYSIHFNILKSGPN
jgi:hypothetical protein